MCRLLSDVTSVNGTSTVLRTEVKYMKLSNICNSESKMKCVLRKASKGICVAYAKNGLHTWRTEHMRF